MKDLDPVVRDAIDAQLIRSYEKLQSGDFSGAVQDAEAAWAAVPEPKFDWDVSMSFAHALAETYRDAGLYPRALGMMEALFASKTVEPYEDGPRFIMGTIYFEMGDEENARKWFAEANQISKGRCFRDEDKKYLDFFKSKTARA